MNTNYADLMSTPASKQSTYDPNFSPVIPLIKSEVLQFIEMPSTALNSPSVIVEPYELLWVRDYDEDIYRTYRRDELKRVVFQSQLTSHRSMILHKLRLSTQRLNLHRTTLHLAVYFMDCVRDLCTMHTSKLMLVVTVCIVLAAKIEEAAIDVPVFSQMNMLMKKKYRLWEYRDAEFRLVRLMNFELIRPTAATFAGYFSLNMVTLEDYHNYIRNWHNGSLHKVQGYSLQQPRVLPLFVSYNEMLAYLKGNFFEMIDDTLAMQELVNERPSVLTAACMAAVRRMQCVFPVWTPFLHQLTDYNEDELTGVMEILIRHRPDMNDYQNTRMLNLQETHSSSDSGICSSNGIADDSSFEENQVLIDGHVGRENGEQNQQSGTTEENNQTDMNVGVGDLNDDAEPEEVFA